MLVAAKRFVVRYTDYDAKGAADVTDVSITVINNDITSGAVEYPVCMPTLNCLIVDKSSLNFAADTSEQ